MAYNSLRALRDLKLPFKIAYEIYKLISLIEPAYKFASQEEQKYLSECGGAFDDDGNIRFPNQEKRDLFRKMVEELCDNDVDINVETIVLTEDDFGSQRLTPADIFNLSEFIKFE